MVLAFSAICSFADGLTITNLELSPGGEDGYFYVGLEGSTIYSGYSLDIYVPDGLELCLDEDGEYDIFFDDDDSDIYPYSRKTGYNHGIKSQVNKDSEGTYFRVLCYDGTSNKEFLETSGRLFYVHVKAKTFTKPGDHQVTIKNIALVEQDGTKHVPASVSATLSVSSTAHAAFSVSSTAKWSTCILPFDAELPAGVRAFTCSESDAEQGVLKLVPVESIEAFTPYVLNSETGYSGTLDGTVDPEKYPDGEYVNRGLLNGATSQNQISTGYVLQKLDGGVKFYNCNGNLFSIPAGKCWVDIPAVVGTKSFAFIIEDNTTGVEDIPVSKGNADTIYNTLGQQVKTMLRGSLYIKQGKVIRAN